MKAGEAAGAIRSSCKLGPPHDRKHSSEESVRCALAQVMSFRRYFIEAVVQVQFMATAILPTLVQIAAATPRETITVAPHQLQMPAISTRPASTCGITAG
jgi:hypothetical protein